MSTNNCEMYSTFSEGTTQGDPLSIAMHCFVATALVN